MRSLLPLSSTPNFRMTLWCWSAFRTDDSFCGCVYLFILGAVDWSVSPTPSSTSSMVTELSALNFNIAPLLPTNLSSALAGTKKGKTMYNKPVCSRKHIKVMNKTAILCYLYNLADFLFRTCIKR